MDSVRTALYVRILAIRDGCFVVGLLVTMLPCRVNYLILRLGRNGMFPAITFTDLISGFRVDTWLLTVAQLCLIMISCGVAIFGTRLILLVC